jgi:Xaa-Pro aminopeptidase
VFVDRNHGTIVRHANRYTQTVRRLLLLLILVLPLPGAVSPEFAARREKLRKDIPNGVLVLFGNRESDDLHYGFYQDTNFFYLTGWEEPGAILVMTPEPEKDDPAFAVRSKLPREILFLPQRVPAEEKWTGRKLGPDDNNASSVTGVKNVFAAERFEAEMGRLLENYASVYAVAGGTGEEMARKTAPLRAFVDAGPRIAKLRMEKSPSEISAIQKATDVSVSSHLAAWKATKPGKYEYEIASAMELTWLAQGCRRGAYAPIVGSGPNSTTLHYSRNSRRMDSGEVVVMDVAAECDNYASDVTRTIPANGKFTARQREIYNIVLGAQRAAIAAVKPGALITRAGLYQIAFDYINTHGTDRHGESLGKYFTHGLSHHVGLDVHDLSDNNTPLRAGMVITIEPGIYIPEENIGVRIEDTVLVTEDGSRVMSAALPTDPDAIERAMAGGGK